ncbi:MAG: hypothetical protein GF349_00640 [Candidatus Magasanikbacteria bacterium]|nr:hypothetical protein [Candidatus Magasanikbacteria bacterium]
MQPLLCSGNHVLPARPQPSRRLRLEWGGDLLLPRQYQTRLSFLTSVVQETYALVRYCPGQRELLNDHLQAHV